MTAYLKKIFSKGRSISLAVYILLLSAFVLCYSRIYLPWQRASLKPPVTVEIPAPEPEIPESEEKYILYRSEISKLRLSEPNVYFELDANTAVKIPDSGLENILLHRETDGIPVLFVSSSLKLPGSTRTLELPETVTAVLSPDAHPLSNTGAFYKNKSITAFIPSENLMYIGNKSFYGCENLKNVFLPTKLSHIGDRAFYNCKSIEEISVFGYTSIGEGAFAGCDSLTNVYLSEKVQRVGIGAFENTPFYENLTDEFCIVGDILIKYNGNGGDVIVPDGVRIIADGTFAGRFSIKSVKIPESVEYIGNSAFRSCVNLTEVYIDGEKKTVVGENAFEGCPLINYDEVASLVCDSRDMLLTDNSPGFPIVEE
ncbi:MAG: leucine-rich repeat protein [Clostridia bacterium]|nr:leucine-rich repeat protein [Clostridia bacterium]